MYYFISTILHEAPQFVAPALHKYINMKDLILMFFFKKKGDHDPIDSLDLYLAMTYCALRTYYFWMVHHKS